MRIRAAIARAREPFELAEVELDEPRVGEVAVAVEACGICSTDLSAKDHDFGTPLPAVLGHEGVGRITAVGEGVRGLEVGQRVVMSFGACGRCPNCREGAPGYCERGADYNLLGRRLDGTSPIRRGGEAITGHFFGQSSFATHAVAAATNVVPVADDLPAVHLCPLACGVQTGAGAMLHVLEVGPVDAVGVFGCGTVGLAAVMAAKIAGCASIVAVDRRPERLELARALGATHAIDGAELDGAALVRALRELGGLTRAFDNTGSTAVIEAAFAGLRPRGVLALAGVSPRRARITLDANRLMLSGRSVRGTVEGDAHPRSFIPQMIDWYTRGLLPVERLVTTYPFEQINQAAADMAAGRVIKPVLRMT
ncbi:MAG: NAD(P)-dependent alcohol dehydrogenase [Myxococcales bacterium]|nr:NAD(P)-dependent alcohol dehydrogenase [Myxococcales bacterium]